MTSTQTTVGIFLSFLGGAAAGAIAVYASNPENRKKVRDAFESSRRMVNRVPAAFQDVKVIATEALVEARDNAKEAIVEAGHAAKQVMASPSAARNGPRIA